MTSFEHVEELVRLLDRDLVDPPDRLASGRRVPVATWAGPRYGAVVMIEDCEHDPFCPDDEHYSAMTYTFRRVDDHWEWRLARVVPTGRVARRPARRLAWQTGRS